MKTRWSARIISSLAARLEHSPIPRFSGCSPLKVNFKANSTSTLLYTWDFGDGQVDYVDVDSTTHLYKNNGVYRPALILTDSNNCSLTYYNNDSVQIKALPLQILRRITAQFALVAQ